MTARLLGPACLFALHLGVSHGRLYNDLKELPRVDWDFVIVGAGPAGSVLAHRLSEVYTNNVLLIEAGASHENILEMSIPFFASRLITATPWDWNYTTTPQEGLEGRELPFPRGHVLGGSSSTNFMAYTRGSADDYDEFAGLTGDVGWSWENVLPYFMKSETWSTTSPKPELDCTRPYDPSVHGTNGRTGVSQSVFGSEVDCILMSTTEDPASEFLFNQDFNSGTPLGLGWPQYLIGNGTRSSAATAYLGKDAMARRNLHVVINTLVIRVLEGRKGDTLSMNQVELVSKVNGSKKLVKASKEVILSAGSVGSPVILLRSGIGKTTLPGTTLLHRLPDVGQNLVDHPMFTFLWKTNFTDSFEAYTQNATRMHELVELWNTTKSGPLANAYANAMGWYRLPEDDSIFSEEEDPSSGDKTAHLEFIFINGNLPANPMPDGNYFSVAVALLTPSSTGSLTLASSDPFEAPRIDSALLTTKFDVHVMRQGAKLAQRFANLPAMKDVLLEPVNFDPNWTHDELDKWIRENTVSVFHPMKTCRASRKGSKIGVVDPDLKVKGVKGLRVVDASVFPLIISGHTTAPVYALAERAADLIKEEWWRRSLY